MWPHEIHNSTISLMTTGHMTSVLLKFHFYPVIINTPFQWYYSCVKGLDTANGFMHTYTAGPVVFTLPPQRKEWCRIIHWWLKTTEDPQHCLQDGKSVVGCVVEICERKVLKRFSKDLKRQNCGLGMVSNSEAQSTKCAVNTLNKRGEHICNCYKLPRSQIHKTSAL